MATTAPVKTTAAVVCTFDVDCDGTGFAFHRVSVPVAALLTDDYEAAKSYAVQTEQMSGYGDACAVLTIPAFLRQYRERMDEFDFRYWSTDGYFSYVNWRR